MKLPDTDPSKPYPQSELTTRAGAGDMSFDVAFNLTKNSVVMISFEHE